jgi:phage FluMu gp28-like protein
MMSRQSGKSFTVASKAVYRSISIKNNLTIIVSVNQRSADEFLRKVKQWALACKTFKPELIDYTENASSVTFNNGSRVISLPANPASLRGFSGDVILDEWALVDNTEEMFKAVLPVITSKMNGNQKTLTVCSTPTSLDSHFAKLWFDESG